MSKKALLVIGAVLLLAAGVAYYFLGMNTGPSDDSTLGLANTDLVKSDEHIMGNPNAPITIIEYFAQACSVCSRFDQDIFPLLKAKYIDTGKVRYVMRLYPLFPVDGPSYKLDMCMPSDRFFQSVDLLFRNQPKWDSGEYPVSDPHAGLIQMARIMGMDASQADACMNSTKLDASINKVAEDANTRYQINTTGTPTFVLNYKKADMQFDPRDPQGSWQRVQGVINAALTANK